MYTIDSSYPRIIAKLSSLLKNAAPREEEKMLNTKPMEKKYLTINSKTCCYYLNLLSKLLCYKSIGFLTDFT